MKDPAFYTASLAIGDCICATPTIRKLSSIYNRKVTVFSHHPDIFSRLPYVEKSLDVKDYIQLDQSEKLRSDFDLHYSFWRMGQKVPLSDDRGIEFKHAIMDIRQYHSVDSGFMLLRDEMQCDYTPEASDIVSRLPKRYVCLHPFINWPSRTWSNQSWKNLIANIRSLGLDVVIIGKDSIDLNLIDYLKKGVKGKTDSRVFEELGSKRNAEITAEDIVDLTNKTTLSEAWHIINSSECFVTMDSGLLHLAGTTDAEIIQLGSSINPEFRAPYRKGSQSYKYHYIKGPCNLFCASNLKYSLRDWEYGYSGGTPIQSVPLIDTCLERKETMECHPSDTQVFNTIEKILSSGVTEIVNEVIDENKENKDSGILVKIASKSLGDQIGAIAAIGTLSLDNNVTVLCDLGYSYFKESYPKINFISSGIDPELDILTGEWLLDGKRYSKFEVIHYKFDKPLIKGYADQLDVNTWERPKIDFKVGPRPIKNKYVCFSMHSTAQAKHWNYPNGWDTLCRMLRKEGITPVCIDRHYSFGIEGHWNPIPGAAVKKQNMDLSEISNYIHHSEFFIGISSGLSWVAHALGKKVIMISGVTSEDNEFEEDTIRVMNKKVCHGCINSSEIKFDVNDWLWCPLHKNTERQFECTKQITPDEVLEAVKKII
jgi:autotransporter strand-loop-strand O-heptosyltransferase